MFSLYVAAVCDAARSLSVGRQVRQRVVSRLEVWLQNPKWSRPAQELLVSLCSNLTSHTQFDVDVISQLVKFRIKAKPIVNLYLSCMRSVTRSLAMPIAYFASV